MRRLLTPKRLLGALLLGLLLLLAAVAQEFRLFERAWFPVQEWRHRSEWRAVSIWLPDYRVVIEAQPIAGLEDDVSALTYDPDRKTL
ncbi:MAG: SdiA-regulated domain-containing protein, partial [Pseudomonas sp.]